MADSYIKNMEFSTVLSLAAQVDCQPGQIVSKTIAQNNCVSLTLFAFDKGEEISSHESNGDAMVVALEGVGEITVGDGKFTLHAGDTVVMPSKKPHAVLAVEPFKMFLIVLFK